MSTEPLVLVKRSLSCVSTFIFQRLDGHHTGSSVFLWAETLNQCISKWVLSDTGSWWCSCWFELLDQISWSAPKSETGLSPSVSDMAQGSAVEKLILQCFVHSFIYFGLTVKLKYFHTFSVILLENKKSYFIKNSVQMGTSVCTWFFFFVMSIIINDKKIYLQTCRSYK